MIPTDIDHTFSHDGMRLAVLDNGWTCICFFKLSAYRDITTAQFICSVEIPPEARPDPDAGDTP